MASASGGDSGPLSVKLALLVNLEDKRATSDIIFDVYGCVRNGLRQIIEELGNDPELASLHITEVVLSDNDEIALRFILNDEDELINLHACIDRLSLRSTKLIRESLLLDIQASMTMTMEQYSDIKTMLVERNAVPTLSNTQASIESDILPGDEANQTSRGNLTIIDESNTDEPLVRKTFYIQVPFPETEIIQVYIECEELQTLERMKFISHGHGIYSSSLELSISRERNILYRYEVKLRGYLRNSTKQSDAYFLSDASEQRDLWERFNANGMSGIVGHAIDIIRLSKEGPLNTRAIELENLMDGVSSNFLANECNEMLKSILQTLKTKESMSSPPLVAVVIGKLFIGKMYQVDSITPIQAGELLQSLSTVRIDQFPESAQKYMSPVCATLIKIKTASTGLLLRHMSFTYPLFDVDTLNIWICDKIQRKQTLCQDDADSKQDAERLITSLLSNYSECEELPTQVHIIINSLLRCLPIGVACKVYQLVHEAMVGWNINFSDQIYIRCVDELKRVKRDLSSMLQLWNKLGTEERSLNNITVLFEKEILETLSKNIYNNGEILLAQLLEAKGLFVNAAAQNDFLTTIANSTTLKIYGQMKMVLEHEKYKSISNDVIQRVLTQWLKTIMNTQLQGARLHSVVPLLYESYFFAVSKLIDCRETVLQLDKHMIAFLKTKGLKTILNELWSFESVCTRTTECEACIRHLQVLIREMHPGFNSDELIDSVFSFGRATVNSRIKYAVIKQLIQIYSPGSQTSIVDRFINMVHRAHFWERLFEVSWDYKVELRSDALVKEGQQCIHQMIDLLETHRITFREFLQIDALPIGDVKTLLYCYNPNKKVVDKLLKNYKTVIQSNRNNLKTVCEVLSDIRCHMTTQFRENTECFIKKTQDIYKQFDSMSPTEYLSEEGIWNGIDYLIQPCNRLQAVVKSTVFWNINRNYESNVDGTEIFDDDDEIQDDEADYIQYVRYLFKARINPASKHICRFLEVGSRRFSEAWRELETNASIGMKDIRDMFTGIKSTMNEEIDIAENHLGYSLPLKCKSTLRRIDNFAKSKRFVDAIHKSINAFHLKLIDDKEFRDAVESFHRLLDVDNLTLTFNQASSCLQIVNDIENRLSNGTVLILESAGKASTLFEFLQNIAEDDIRNLIDAVEDISEQHVNENTVSALIDVQRFYKPLHQHILQIESKSVSFFEAVQRQVDVLCNAADGLPHKIEDCMSNLHNLKSLYNNVANRGEQTKEVINNIIRKGQVHFMLCPEDKACDFNVTYEQDKNQQTMTHIKNAIHDYRSRALLLMNTEKQKHDTKHSKHDLEKFISFVDFCNEISSVVYQLHVCGHIEFKLYNSTIDLKQLEALNVELVRTLHAWQDNLNTIRRKFYLMNFFQGKHIHALDNFFQRNDDVEIVKALVQYIHPELQLDSLRDNYQAIRLANESIDQLQLIGISFHTCYERLSPFSRKIALAESKTRITEIVQDDRLFVARLDEGSTQLVRCMLALFLKATGALPEPYQVLICSRDTMWDELELLLGRCLGAHEFFGRKTLFCITNIELLSSEVLTKLTEELKCLQEMHFWLAVICQCNQHHHIVDEFSDNIVPVRSLSEKALKDIFHKEYPYVCTYTSEVSGLGKSSAISRLAFSYGKQLKTLHISGPVKKRILVDRLCNLQLKSNEILHINVGDVDIPTELDKMLFELIIMRYIDADFLSVGLPTDFVAIEVGNTINDNLRNSLTTAVSFKREHLKWNDYDDFTVSMEVNSPVQVVCHYVKALDKGILDKQDLYFTGNSKEQPLSASECRQILRTCFNSASDSSFSTVNTCLNVLADQLKKMSFSTFFRTARIAEMVDNKTLPTVRSTMVKGLIDISKEFSSRSVSAYRSTQQQTVQETKDNEYNHDDRNKPKSKDLASVATHRVQGMIRWDDSNHLIFVFHSQNIHTVSPMYRDKTKVPSHIKQLFEGQIKKALPDLTALNQQQLQDILQRIARKQQPLPSAKLQELARHYALTPDNLLKMVLIMLRIKARIPIIIMGETGCGKTSLVRYLASICEIPFDVVSVHAGLEENTLIKRIQHNHELARSDLSTERWVFFDEINTSEYIGLLSEVVCHQKCLGAYLSPNLVFMAACNPYKLRSADAIFTSGLKSKAKSDELSRLVYRVHPLPEMLVDYVWDFGSLTDADEMLYIERMMAGMLSSFNRKVLVEILGMSQTFTRSLSGTTSCVSLRDVQRCKVLLSWFLEVACKKNPKRTFTPYRDQEITAIILSLAHCYQSRYAKNTQRKSYRKEIAKILHKHGIHDLNSDGIHRIISQEQKDILARMELPPGTAENVALQENIFVLLVCILTRIPIFLVGKPGCSKSLSMQVIKSNLRGKDSVDDFFKNLPQLYVVSFQGSESSTSDGIIKVFEKAENYQKVNKTDEVLSVVLLDEIGLAEVSRFNPLKVLHNLLEPNGLSRPNVAVVGISNWCLDESKMNRAVHLSRPEMDLEELHDTAISISESFESTELTILGQGGSGYHFKADDIRHDLSKVAKSYLTYIENMHFKNFHGLRDYYSLVKYFTRELSLTNTTLSKEEISEKLSIGVHRNFGGLPDEHDTLLQAFGIQNERKLTVLGLIRENLCDTMARHLMLITTGESVTGILERELDAAERGKREILFGSQFEEDLTDDYNYRILSRIILCMEQGMVLILKDLENIYGSLYDMLNKHYTEIGKKKLCRVALGAHSNPFCQVHEDFKCIVLVDKKQVMYSDPPFLNRFEKHYLQFSDITSNLQKKVISSLEDWLHKLTSETDFQKDLCFPIYSCDMLSALVLKMSDNDSCEECDLLEKCQRALLWIIQPEVIVRAMRSKIEADFRQIECRFIESYFALPVHAGLAHFVEYQLDDCKHDERFDDGLLTIVFTNSNVHTKMIRGITVRSHAIVNIGAFKSEKQFSLSMKRFWLECDEEILFVVCSVGHEQHIMLAKSVIERYRQERLMKGQCMSKHVYFLIHVDRNMHDVYIASAISYLGGWELVMLDSIDRSSITVPEFCNMTLLESLMRKRPLQDHLKDKLLWTFTRIKYPKLGRSVESFTTLLETMKNSQQFISFIEEQIFIWLKTNHTDINATTWTQDVASNAQAMKTSMTFIDALEKHILTVVNIPLSKLIYRMEESNVLDCFFIEDHLTEERRASWKEMVCRKTILSIYSVPDESGPESYVCDHHEIFLKLPFSMHVFRVIEETKDELLQSVILLRGKLNLDEDDDLPRELVILLLSQHESTILQKIPDLTDFMYSNDDYVHDYCNLISYTTCSSLDRDKRVRFMRRIVGENLDLSDQKPLSLVTNLHSYVWMNYRSIYAVMQLIEFCFSETGLDKESLKSVENVLSDTSLLAASSTTTENDDDHLDIQFDESQVHNSVSPGESDTNEYRSDIQVNDILSDIDTEEQETEETHGSFMLTEESQSIKTEEERLLQQNLVEIICEKMLPLEETADLETWLRKSHTTLTLCSNVSLIPESLDELRLCYDLAIRIIVPYGIGHAWLTKMATLLHTHNLDSSSILGSFMEMVLEAPSDARVDGFKMVSKVLVGCLFRDPDTAVICMFFSWIMENKIPDDVVWLFYAPVRLAVQLTCAEDPGVWFDLINRDDKLCKSNTSESSTDAGSTDHVSDQQHDDGELLETLSEQPDNVQCETDEEEIQGVSSNDESKTMTYLDKCLTYVVNTSETCLFVTMVTDILLEIYNDTGEEDQCDEASGNDVDSKLPTFLKCHKLIETETGLRRVAAIAFTKYFIESLAPNVLDPEMHVPSKQALKSILNSCPGNDVGAVLGNYLVKLLGRDLPVVQFCQRNQQWLKNTFSELQCEELKDDSFENGFELFPLVRFTEVSPCFMNEIFSVKEGQTLSTKMEQFFFKNAQTVEGILTVLSIALKHFYIVRPMRNTTDTEATHAKIFYGEAEKQIKDGPTLKLLKCLLGQKDFGFDELMVDEGSETVDCIISSWMASFYSFLIAHQVKHVDGPLPIMIRCLTQPLSVATAYLPGFPDSMNEPERPLLCSKSTTECRFVTCECGHRLAFFKQDKAVCTVCQANIPCIPIETCNLADTISVPGYIDANVTYLYKRRELTPLSQHILCLMIKCCLLGSVALDISSVNDLANITSLDGPNIPVVLWQDIKEHWTKLSKLLNVDENTVSLILHASLAQSRELLCMNNAQLTNAKERESWENYFQQIVCDIRECPFSVIRKMFANHYEPIPNESQGEVFLRELESLQTVSENTTTEALSRLFRLTGGANILNLTQEVLERSNEYPFLLAVLEKEQSLDLPKYMLPLIQWHIIVVSRACFLFKRQELMSFSVEDFLRKCGSKDLLLKEGFKCFMENWNKIRKRFIDLNLNLTLTRVNFQTNLAESLVLDKDSIVYRVLEILIQVQNEFIDVALLLSKHSQSVGWYVRKDNHAAVIPQVEITDLNKQHLIDFKLNWDDIFKQDSLCALEYNLGRKIVYDLEGIERELALKILVGKVYIGLKGSLPALRFTDELYRNYVSLVNDVKEVVEQVNLPHVLISSIKTSHQNDPKMASELLTYLGMVLTWLKKTKGNPGIALVDYIDKWQSIFSDSFPKHLLPSPQNSLLLCHVVAFHEFLEELSSESILESQTDEFRLDLEAHWEGSLKDLVKSERRAAEVMLKALKRFTYRCLSLRDAEPDTALLHHLRDVSFWPDDAFGSDGVKGADGEIPIEQLIPPGMTVGHIYWITMTIENEFEIIRQNDLKISKIATSYHSQKRPAKTGTDNRKKILKRFQKRS